MVAQLRRRPGGFAATALAVVAFGIAFGYLEAAVVVYLRAALEIAPGAVPGHDPATFGTFEAVEIALSQRRVDDLCLHQSPYFR